jgi:hypothetical protein
MFIYKAKNRFPAAKNICEANMVFRLGSQVRREIGVHLPIPFLKMANLI